MNRLEVNFSLIEKLRVRLCRIDDVGSMYRILLKKLYCISSFQRSADKKTNFVKVYAPWEILARYAEIFNLKMPIKVRVCFNFSLLACLIEISD